MAYAQTVGFGYTDLDDIRLIEKSQSEIKQGVSLVRIFSQDVFGDGEGTFFYRPILALIFILDTALGGGAAWFYHLSNLLWHMAACCLFLWLLTIMGVNEFPALAAALLIGVHPALAQAVAWIPGRNDVMMAFFLILSLAGAAKYFREGPGGWLLLSVASYLLALFTKETAVVFPLACLASWGRMNGLGKPRYGQMAALFLGATVLWLAARLMISKGELGFGLPLERSAGFAALGLLSYLGKIVFPFGLSLTPAHRDVNIILGLAGLAILSLLLWWGRPEALRRYRPGLVFMAAFLLPATLGEIYLEHRLYLPLMGLATSLVQTKFLKTDELYKARWLVWVVLAALTLINWLHSASFRSEESAWAKALSNSPNSWLAQNAMGKMDSQHSRYGVAESRYLKALEINPGQPKVLNNLGLLYLKSNRLKMAEQVFAQLLARHPKLKSANYHMAQVMDRLGHPDQAVEYYQRELAFDPSYAGAWTGLGASLAQTGQLDKAKRALEKAVRLDGGSYEAWLNLGVVEFRLRNLTNAVANLEKAVRISPQRAEGWVNLGYACRALGDTSAARQHFQMAGDLDPRYRPILDNGVKKDHHVN